MYSSGPPHMDKQKQNDQLEPTYSSSVPIRDVALKTCRKQWTTRRGFESGSGISVLMARHDDDDELSTTKIRKKKYSPRIMIHVAEKRYILFLSKIYIPSFLA